jgi:hypothetical protein
MKRLSILNRSVPIKRNGISRCRRQRRTLCRELSRYCDLGESEKAHPVLVEDHDTDEKFMIDILSVSRLGTTGPGEPESFPNRHCIYVYEITTAFIHTSWKKFYQRYINNMHE